MDIDQKVLAAFQVEHKEQLQRIRTLLDGLQQEGPASHAPDLDEAFRLAHSLKGGARVCALQPAEALGHALETVFSRLREGQLDLGRDTLKTINLVLDSIEDWMAALAAGDQPPELTEAFAATESLLAKQAERGEAQDDSDELATRLRAAFQQEYLTYAEGLRAFLQRGYEHRDTRLLPYGEAFRMAHDLRASAQAAEIRGVEPLAEELESLFRRLREGDMLFDDEIGQRIDARLDAVDKVVAALSENPSPVSRDVEYRGVEPLSSPGGDQQSIPEAAPEPKLQPPVETSPAPARVEQQIETVRIRTDSLDRLLQSSGQLLSETLRQQQLTRELAELRRTVELMERDRESIRRVVGSSLYRDSGNVHLRNLARYFDSMDRHILLVGQSARQLYLKQQRSCWLLQACGNQIQDDLRQARMVSAESLFQGFPKMVRDLAKNQGRQVEFKMVGADVRADRMVLQELKAPLMHMLRNSVIHGIEPPEERLAKGKPQTGQISLTIQTVGNRLRITVEDDGRGVDLDQVADAAARSRNVSGGSAAECSSEDLSKLIFQPGFSTCTTASELAGRGMGLSVVHEAVKRLQGEVQLLPIEGSGTAIFLGVPLSICTHRVLLVAVGEQTFAVPLHAIERLLRTKPEEIEMLESAPVVTYDRRPIPFLNLGRLVGMDEPKLNSTGGGVCTMILKNGSHRIAVGVDALFGERDALLQQLDETAMRDGFAGAILSEQGLPVLVLNPAHLLARAQRGSQPLAINQETSQTDQSRPPCVLVVDDSFTTRTLEKSILEAHGYEVHVAMDGMEAISKLQCTHYDLVITDVEMPRLDGFGLLEEMKHYPRLSELPVILVTSRDRPEDRRRGLDLGADAYIVKRKFDHEALMSTIQQVL